MQNRIGKKQYYRIDGKISSFSRPCFHSLAQGITLLLLALVSPSCAHQKAERDGHERGIKQLTENMHKICFGGEGKGRAHFRQQNFSFRYEAILDLREGIWGLGVQIPGMGDEIIKLDWSKIQSGEFDVRGSFYYRLKSLAQQSKLPKRYLRHLQEFLKNYSLFLRTWQESFKDSFMKDKLCRVERFNETQYWGHCQTPNRNHEFYWTMMNGRLEFEFKGQQYFRFKITAFDLGDFFKRLRLSWAPEDYYGHGKAPLQLDLFVEQCSVKR